VHITQGDLNYETGGTRMEEYINLILGPFGALVVMAFVLFGLYRVGIKHILPLIKSSIDKHLEQVDRMLDSHKEDREIFKETIKQIVSRLDKVEDDVSYIKGKIDNE
jgi:hypothetical protein|tara:strand:- start:28 stop:348 length:321 start_codon:yes stop_codon:yes gene_type:complete